MKQFFIILTVFNTLTACNNSADRSKIIKTDIPFEDSTVLIADADSIHFSGSITKVVYPLNPLPYEDSLISYAFDCLDNKLKIHVPCNYLRTDYLQYTEGEILTIQYPDSSTISILCGTMADISTDNNKTKGLYNKNIIVKGYQITFADVPEQKLQLFNSAFELLNEDIK